MNIRCAAFLVALAFGCLGCVHPRSAPEVSGALRVAGSEETAESVTSEVFEQVRSDPAALRAFLEKMPLGGDLHHHASGAIPPETLVRFAAEEGLCLPRDPDADWVLQPGPCDASQRSAAEVLESPSLLDEAADRWSMRNYLASDPAIDRREAHDHFFGIFGQIDLATNDLAKLLAEGRRLAADENVLYLETSSGWVADRALRAELYETPWDDDLGRLRRRLLADPRFREVVERSVAELPAEFARADEILGCGTADPDPGCAVEVRLQQIALRVVPPQVVFVQTLIGYEMVAASPHLVAVNLVAPETDPVSIRDYDLHMRIHAELAPHYPAVRRTFHAAEMTVAEARALGATDHLAVAIADAERGGGDAHRIGHGVSLAAEIDRDAVLAKMREDSIAVELNLRSNLQLLGVEGDEHPILDYLEAGIPIVLSTDDPGLMVTGLREQFEVAASYREIDYPALKRFVRNSIDYSFLEMGARIEVAKRLEERLAKFEEEISGVEARPHAMHH